MPQVEGGWVDGWMVAWIETWDYVWKNKKRVEFRVCDCGKDN